MNYCSGCGICRLVCPKSCIEIVINQDGFYEQRIDLSKCLHCNVCKSVCPFDENKKKLNTPAKACFYRTYSHEDLRKSSSGGICTNIAETYMESGKDVLGAVYNASTHRVEHIVANGISDVERMRGSKYMQSDTAKIMEYIKESKKEFVFFGTPCQVCAMHKYLSLIKKRDQALLIDFACHGTPSLLLWDRYLEKWIHSNGNERKVSFRDKKFGWNDYCINIQNENANTYSPISKGDFYLRAFLSDLCLNDVCYEQCSFHGKNSFADIRVGDAWGETIYKDNKGTSIVMIYTERGADVIEKMSNKGAIVPSTSDEVYKEQLNHSIKRPFLRKLFLELLKTNIPLNIISVFVLKPYYFAHVVLKSYLIKLIKMMKGV